MCPWMPKRPRWNDSGATALFLYMYPTRKDSTTGYIVGPTTVDAGQTVTWELVPQWSTWGYDVNWTINGTPMSGAQYATTTISGPGAKTLTAEYATSDGVSESTQITVWPRVTASIAGPTTITATGTFEYVAGPTNVTGATPAYSWWRVDQGTNATTYLGAGASASVVVDESTPNLSVSVLVSATGYVPQSALLSVSVTGTGCGGLACLMVRAPQLQRAAGRKR